MRKWTGSEVGGRPVYKERLFKQSQRQPDRVFTTWLLSEDFILQPCFHASNLRYPFTKTSSAISK